MNITVMNGRKRMDEAGVRMHHGYEWIAAEAYAIADAMLKARGET